MKINLRQSVERVEERKIGHARSPSESTQSIQGFPGTGDTIQAPDKQTEGNSIIQIKKREASVITEEVTDEEDSRSENEELVSQMLREVAEEEKLEDNFREPKYESSKTVVVVKKENSQGSESDLK